MAIINGTALSDNGVAAPALFGTIFADLLNANWSAGEDAMIGGAGNDTYNVNSAGDQVLEAPGGGIDTVVSRLASYTLGFDVENLTLDNTFGAFSTALNGTGNTLANVMTGNDRNNILSGGDGNDTISGGNGIDTLNGDNGDDSLNGGIGNDALNGGFGNDTLNGGTGTDTMTGSIGNDTYFVDAAGDVVVEGAFLGGIDTVFSSVSETLDANVENLTLQNVFTAVNGTGNIGNNIINGNNFNNTLSGLDGADTVNGAAGNDTISGGNGNDVLGGGSGNDSMNGGANDDVLAGSAGVDTLTGGIGNDRFQFADRGVANADTITDFSEVAGNDDRIVLLNALDNGLAGAVSPGILGLAFLGGNVAGNALNGAWFFKGAGFDGNGNQLSGIFVNTNTGQLWYNPTTNVAGDSQFFGTVNAAAIAALDASDFIYG